jgi:aryl-alcohol dehydrogenase-like predicted oxidoreductase
LRSALTERVQLGRTGLDITRIGFGAWAAGGSNWEHGWSGQEDTDSVRALERAVDLGINWIDTAAAYGFGHSEEIIGRTLQGVRAKPLVFTKCTALGDSSGQVVWSQKRDSIRAEVEASLRRLRTDRIDLYQIHRPLPAADIEEGWATLAALKAEKTVRHIGVSNFTVEQLRQIEQLAPVETIQPPYSALKREAEDDLFPYAAQAGAGVIVYSPMASGLLSGTMTRERLDGLPEQDWRRHDERFAEPTLSRGLELAERMRAVAERHDASVGAVAIAWTLRHPAVHGAIVGFRRAEQVDGLVRGATLTLSEDDVSALECA